MPDLTSFGLFFSAAFLLAITPGPGIMYVLTRSLKGGRGEGYASSFGTAIGGMFHVVAAGLGLSAILATSATAFTIIKFAGAAYLIYLGFHTIFAPDEIPEDANDDYTTDFKQVLLQGAITELLNPKTAIFFLAFIPQFINPDSVVVTQFLLLGTISVMMNTTADIVVATMAGSIGKQLKQNAKLRQGQRIFTGTGLIALGAYVAFSGDH
jgi:threonine/homoserine/homoserine lactone efflux protein